MNRRQFLTCSGLILAGALGACGLPVGAGSGQSQELAQQFLTERNGGTPVAIGGGGPNAPIFGSVESVEGSKLMVKRPMEGSIATIQLADGAAILKDVEIQLGDVKAGDAVTAFGAREGDVFETELLRLGGAMSGGPVLINRQTAPGTNAPATDMAPANGARDTMIGGDMAEPVTGTVETIDGNSLVIKDKGGASTTLKLAKNAKIHTSAPAALADLTAGTFILASGAQSGDVFQATQVQIMAAPKQP